MRRKFNVISAFILVLAGGWFMPLPAEALSPNTWYIATTGNDTTGNGNEANPWATLKKAFASMAGGDTLIIKDGTYTGNDNLIRSASGGFQPPNGTAENYTVVKAENLGKVTFVGGINITGAPADLVGNSYWQFEKIKWIGSVSLYKDHYVKFFQCVFEGEVPDGNTAVFNAHTCDHVLLEDCIAYGKGRFKFLIYLSTEVVLRRCVGRNDYANRNASSSMPIATFSIYSSSSAEIQNCISIDSDQPQFWHDLPTNIPGSFSLPASAGPTTNVKIKGSISLNIAAGGSDDSFTNSGIIFENNVFWHQTDGPWSKPSQGVIFRHNTIGDLKTGAEMGLSDNQISKLLVPPGIGISSHSTYTNQIYTENNIITGAFYRGLSQISSSTGNALWNNSQNYYSVTTVTNDITGINPFANSLKYLPRIESDSDLSGKATDGGDIGANIVKRIGRSGTLYGEAGYDEVTGENLWPWPYEDWIKEQMGTYNQGGTDPGLPRGDRGFAAYVSSFGSPNTLTSYIWEYLGNPLPPEIYGTLKGDLNLDGRVSIADIQLCIKVILGTETNDAIVQKAKELAAPYDAATIKDIQEIIRIILGG